MKEMKFAVALAGLMIAGAARAAGGPMICTPDKDGQAKIDAIVADWKPALPAKKGRVLVCSRCDGYRHGMAIGYGNYMLMKVQAMSDAFTFDFAQDFTEVNDPNLLAKYDALLLNCTTMISVKKNPKLDSTLTEFVRSGKGLCLVHAAVDSFYDSPAIQEMNGGLFCGHPWHIGGVWGFVNEKPDSPLTASFGGQKKFHLQDEIYMHRSPPYNRETCEVLISLDMSDAANRAAAAKGWNKKPVDPDGDYAVSWCKNYGRGRVFYTSFGHDHRTYLDRARVHHILDGLRYTIGR